MKLSELVNLRLSLLKLLENDSTNGIRELASNIRTIHGGDATLRLMSSNAAEKIIASVDAISICVEEEINALIIDLDKRIEDAAAVCLDTPLGYLSRIHPTWILDDNGQSELVPIPDHVQNHIIGRIQHYADWHYPGLIIHPQHPKFFEPMVVTDPLYVVGRSQEMIDRALAGFHPLYQGRVRQYLLDDKHDFPYFSTLPQGQINLVFAWDFFNCFPTVELQKYLKSIFSLLRPGGAMIFSFNDGETYNGAKQAECGGMAYTPKSKLVALVEDIGYTVENSACFDYDIHAVSLLEIKKPGILTTTKAHPTLGKIQNISK